MPGPSKRKNSESKEDISSDKVCIIHSDKNCDGDPGVFTPLNKIKSDPKEKLTFLHDIKEKRLAQPLELPFRMESACSSLPDDINEQDLENLGYHRLCYQLFTGNLQRLKLDHGASESLKKHHPPRRSSATSSSPIFPPECAWNIIEEWADEMKDYNLCHKIKGIDLFAAEVQFHPSCRRRYSMAFRNHVGKDSKTGSEEDTE